MNNTMDCSYANYVLGCRCRSTIILYAP